MNLTTKRKRAYNKGTYKRYEFSVNLDTKLNYLLEDYKEQNSGGISSLIKGLLSAYFKVESDELYFPYHFGDEK